MPGPDSLDNQPAVPNPAPVSEQVVLIPAVLRDTKAANVKSMTGSKREPSGQQEPLLCEADNLDPEVNYPRN